MDTYIMTFLLALGFSLIWCGVEIIIDNHRSNGNELGSIRNDDRSDPLDSLGNGVRHKTG